MKKIYFESGGPPCPCVKSCEDRTTECHSTCDRYLQYEKDRGEFYEKKWAENLGTPVVSRAHQKWLDGIAKDNRRRRRTAR